MSIGSLVVHPTDSNTVYVGTGEDNGGGYSFDGDGVWKTTDGGATWTNLGLAETRRIGKMAIDRMLLKAPILGLVLRKIAVARFCRTLGTLLEEELQGKSSNP